MAADDGFREIQLSGKNLVALFMATTVVAVVIFMFGVMVGRGVKTRTATTASAQPGTPADAGTTDPHDLPPADARVSAAEDPAYQAQAAARPPADAVKKVAEQQPVEPPDVPAEVPGAVAPPAAPAEPVAGEYAVQVAALRERGQANAIRSRLVEKGFSAYVLEPAPGARMFRVRVGNFKERRQAEAVARRLEKEEQFKPWITP